MRTSTQTALIQNEQQVGIKVQTFDNGILDDSFVIPVVDVRRGNDARRHATQIQKDANFHRGSKFLSRSYSAGGNSYQNSHKK